jgi:hypothetical protein
MQNDRAFAGATVLSIALADPEKLLDAKAREVVTQHLLLGMTMWRPVCFLCPPDQLTIAEVDNTRYVLDAVLSALDNFYSGRLASGPMVGGKYAPILAAINVRNQASRDVHANRCVMSH